MQRCWNNFYKTTLGPLELREDKLHPRVCCVGTDREHDCVPFNCHHSEWVKGVKTQAEKMWLWEDYAIQNYEKPKGQIDKALKFGMLLALVLKGQLL